MIIFTEKRLVKVALPLILVPTTCGTGSEGNCFAVLTDDETKDKKSLRDYSVIAKASVIDPELMMTMPKKVTASSVGFVDALPPYGSIFKQSMCAGNGIICKRRNSIDR